MTGVRPVDEQQIDPTRGHVGHEFGQLPERAGVRDRVIRPEPHGLAHLSGDVVEDVHGRHQPFGAVAVLRRDPTTHRQAALGGRELARQALDLRCRDPDDRGHPLRPREQALKAGGVGGGRREPAGQDDLRHGEREQRFAAGLGGDPLVRTHPGE